MSEISDRINRYMTYRECDAATKNMLIDILYHLADLYVGKNVDKSCIRSMHIEMKALRAHIAKLETPDFYCDSDRDKNVWHYPALFELPWNPKTFEKDPQRVFTVIGCKEVFKKYAALKATSLTDDKTSVASAEAVLLDKKEDAELAWEKSVAALKRGATP